FNIARLIQSLKYTLSLHYLFVSHHHSDTVSPYTTLFRSRAGSGSQPLSISRSDMRMACASFTESRPNSPPMSRRPSKRCGPSRRSEEHTSELQSRENLVCRLLLEKKKQTLRDMPDCAVST